MGSLIMTIQWMRITLIFPQGVGSERLGLKRGRLMLLFHSGRGSFCRLIPEKLSQQRAGSRLPPDIALTVTCAIHHLIIRLRLDPRSTIPAAANTTNVAGGRVKRRRKGRKAVTRKRGPGAVGGRIVHGADCGVAERGGDIAVVGVGVVVVKRHIGPGIRRWTGSMAQRWRRHGLGRRHDKAAAAERGKTGGTKGLLADGELEDWMEERERERKRRAVRNGRGN